MNIVEKLIEGSKIIVNGDKYDVLGKAIYVAEGVPDSTYYKVFLNDDNVLVISPNDNIIYLGKNLGHISEFDGFPEKVLYNENEYVQISHDYQIVLRIIFGNPLEVEGEVEYWDYEFENNIVSTAITSRGKKRADIVAKYLNFDDIEVL